MTREWKQNAWTQATFEDAREFKQIQKFAAACRRLWPGAKITLRPNEERAIRCRRASAYAPETAPGQ